MEIGTSICPHRLLLAISPTDVVLWSAVAAAASVL